MNPVRNHGRVEYMMYSQVGFNHSNQVGGDNSNLSASYF